MNKGNKNERSKIINDIYGLLSPRAGESLHSMDRNCDVTARYIFPFDTEAILKLLLQSFENLHSGVK